MKKMTLAVLVVLVFISACYSQASSPSPDVNGDNLTCSLISGNRAGIITSMDEKRISRLGDRASVEVIKCIGNQRVTAKEIKHILAIVNSAFAAPSIIESGSDRSPKATLLLLNYLTLLADSRDMSSKIQDTVRFVQAKTSGKPLL